MTRPDKYAARFGYRYQPRPDWRRFRRALIDAKPIIHHITEALRQAAERIRAGELEFAPSQTQPGRLTLVPTTERWTFVPHIANPAAPTLAELEAGTPIRVALYTGSPPSAEVATDRYTRRNTPIDWTTATGTFTYEPPREPLDFDAFIAQADEVLAGYDATRPQAEEPWPYRSF
jgi:hypothetical protein